MSELLRVILGLTVVCYFCLLVFFLKKGTLSLKYSLLWIFSGISMGILVLFPELLYLFVYIIDIKSPVNGLFALCIFFIVIIMMSLTSIVSKQNDKIKCLVQDNALLELRIRELEEQNSKEEKIKLEGN